MDRLSTLSRRARFRATIGLASAALAFGCHTAGPRQPTSEPHPALQLVWVGKSAEYRASTIAAFRQATRRVEELAAGREAGTWGVILDADETILSNLTYQREIWDAGETYEEKTWKEWTSRRQATPIAGAEAFLERVHELGGRIAIVTNRLDDQCEDTRANARAVGLRFDVMLCQTAESDKTARWRSVEEGTADANLGPLDVLLYLGDNIRDFPGWSQSRRDDPETAFDDFGRRFILLPNPMYGSWQHDHP